MVENIVVRDAPFDFQGRAIVFWWGRDIFLLKSLIKLYKRQVILEGGKFFTPNSIAPPPKSNGASLKFPVATISIMFITKEETRVKINTYKNLKLQ